MLVIIDNYDSFTYNLYQYLGELGADMKVFRNDKVTVEQLSEMKPGKLLVSPGPCTPKEAGISCEAIQFFAGKIPILGVCLGHQSIGQVFGGNVIRARRLMHGKVSPIHHKNSDIFAGLPEPFEATRYHSLIIEKKSCPDCLEITAWAEEDEIMGVRHKDLPVYGVQFHPESILTANGKQLLQNFLNM
jgi:anthranilate synthase component 2